MKLHPSGMFSNQDKAYERITAVPLASAMGAEVTGVDLADLSDAEFAEIEDALYRPKMLYFRDQNIGHGDQERLTLRFGEFGADAYTTGTPDHPDVQPVIKEADTASPLIFGEGWHTDSPFLARPPSISLLFGAEVPPFGGDTIWANTELAYDTLSEVMKQVVAPLKVHMSASGVLSALAEMNSYSDTADPNRMKMGDIDIDVDRRPMIEGAFHPLVRTHPVTGKKALYVDYTYAKGIEGMTPLEAGALLGFLRLHITQSAFTCRLRWRDNTLAMWDNRSCLHQAFNDHDGFRREMYRTSVRGEAPV